MRVSRHETDLRIELLRDQLGKAASEPERAMAWEGLLEWARPQRTLVTLLKDHRWQDLTRFIPDESLICELDQRAQAIKDLPRGITLLVCPRCSGHDTEILGRYTRATATFHCDECGYRVVGNGYEDAIYDFGLAKKQAEKQVHHENARLADAVSGLKEVLL